MRSSRSRPARTQIRSKVGKGALDDSLRPQLQRQRDAGIAEATEVERSIARGFLNRTQFLE
jgi:hypothetical protein